MITKTPAVTPPAIAPTELSDGVSRIENTLIMLIDNSEGLIYDNIRLC